MSRRMKPTNASVGEEAADLSKGIEITDESDREMNMYDIKAEIENISKKKLKAEKQAREEGSRVQRGPRQRIRRQCCSCEKMTHSQQS